MERSQYKDVRSLAIKLLNSHIRKPHTKLSYICFRAATNTDFEAKNATFTCITTPHQFFESLYKNWKPIIATEERSGKKACNLGDWYHRQDL